MSTLLDSLAAGFHGDAARRAVLDEALRDGLPGARSEAWKYTPLRSLERRGFSPAATEAPEIDPQLLADIPAPRLVFVNGRHAPSLSQLDGLPAGVSLQPLSAALAGGQEAARFLGRRYERADEVFAGNNHAYDLAKKYRLKTAWGTDVLFSAALATQQGAILASLTRWYTPGEALVMATGTNGELLQLTGKRNPYPGVIGVVREGALADLLLVDGDPVADISLITRPEQSFKVIMKGGVIYKDTL